MTKTTAHGRGSARVLERLKAAGQEMTADDVRKQKISFIMGTAGGKRGVSREVVEAEVDRLLGKAAAS